jgi:hypothetical protein
MYVQMFMYIYKIVHVVYVYEACIFSVTYVFSSDDMLLIQNHRPK